MLFTAQCEHCGSVFQVPDTAVGSQFQCSGCGQPVTVPHGTQPNVHAATVSPQKPIPNAPQQYAAPFQQPAPRRAGSGLLIGCVVTLVVLGVLVVGVFFIVRKVTQEVADVVNQVSGIVGMIEGLEQLGNVDEIISEYEENGYEKIERQVITETTPINNKRLYVCQVLEIKSAVNEDIAILAQSATIHGTVEGNLDFGGQALTIEKDAVIKGNVHSRLAQLIVIKGTVEGKVTGGYQVLDADPSRIKGGR